MRLEYISNEVVPYLTRLGAYPESLGPAQITKFLTSTRGQFADLPLDLGGFGISRYAFDRFLYEHAVRRGVNFRLQTEVTALGFNHDRFFVEAANEVYPADVVIAAHGKRSRLDRQLSRKFLDRHSPYVGVKYHIRLSGFPRDLIAVPFEDADTCFEERTVPGPRERPQDRDVGRVWDQEPHVDAVFRRCRRNAYRFRHRGRTGP